MLCPLIGNEVRRLKDPKRARDGAGQPLSSLPPLSPETRGTELANVEKSFFLGEKRTKAGKKKGLPLKKKRGTMTALNVN